MKNIFSYQYGSVFTGKEIKEFLLDWEQKGHSLYGLRQYLNCKDDQQYMFITIQGSDIGSRPRKGFAKVVIA